MSRRGRRARGRRGSRPRADPRRRVRVEDWPASDDFLLREAVEAGAALGAIARGILPFSQPRTREEITARWRALLYDAHVALPAARRMAQYALDAKPRVAPLPTGEEFRAQFEAFAAGRGERRTATRLTRAGQTAM